MTKWMITNRADFTVPGLDVALMRRRFSFYGERGRLVSGEGKRGKFSVYVDGYVLPRQSDLYKFASVKPGQLVPELYLEYGDEFIHHLKGNFVLILFEGEGFRIYTDRMGVRKCFYYVEGETFMFAGALGTVSMHLDNVPDVEHIAVKALMHYYVAGGTFIKGVCYSGAASRIGFGDELTFDRYWHCGALLRIKPEEISYDDFGFKYKSIVKSYLDYLRPGGVSVTLTGGLDSRTVLAGLLANDVRPSVFTYGRGKSGDAHTASRIAGRCGLVFNNYPYPELTGKWFGELAEEVTEVGDSLINIHRAHRLYAMKKGHGDFCETELLMGGFLGGENIRGIFHDNLIVSDFLWRDLSRGGVDLKARESHARELLAAMGFRDDVVDMERLMALLSGLEYFAADGAGEADGAVATQTGVAVSTAKQLYILYLLEAGHHHAQDLNLYGGFVRFPVPIFMDIDFLELLYRGRYDFRTVNSGSNSLLKGIKGHELNCRLVMQLAEPLADIPFLKRGHFTAKEYLGNKFLLLIKRALRQYTAKGVVPNFPLEGWMKEYVQTMYANGALETVADIYNPEALKVRFNSLSESKTAESFWQTYTMPIALSLNYQTYL